MKKLLLILMMFALIVYADDLRVQTNSVGSNANSTVFRIQGAAADTSFEMSKSPVMTFSYFVYDSTGTDSVNLTISWQIQGAGGWQTVKTKTLTTDSTKGYWNITDEPIPPADKHRIVVSGNTGNKVGSYSCLELMYHNNR